MIWQNIISGGRSSLSVHVSVYVCMLQIKDILTHKSIDSPILYRSYRILLFRLLQVKPTCKTGAEPGTVTRRLVAVLWLGGCRRGSSGSEATIAAVAPWPGLSEAATT